MTLAINWKAEEEKEPSTFLSTTITRSRTFRHLLAPMPVRWMLPNFNRIVCNYHTATQWVLTPAQKINFSIKDFFNFLCSVGICIWLVINWILVSVVVDNFILYIFGEIGVDKGWIWTRIVITRVFTVD